uniref:ATP synthase complex subunit 8 n=1 Tax=Stenotrachelus aeneus TaxID=1501903 RepID=A0A343A3K3_9CUCU|nr:ATP synthase F0 subunit 8 [Stenotrachelus aeneus]
MPQMAPMSWLTLMLFFLINLLMFNLINYYSFLPNFKNKLLLKSNINMNWKW